MNQKNRLLASSLAPITVLIVTSALTYLIKVGELTYFKDDWYYVYDAYIAGPGVFREMFRIDRPARGIFFENYYSLFGPGALPYHLSAFVWRMLAGVGALWLFGMLWPVQRRTTFLMTALFLLYPGYLWWISAIEYQPMMASLCLQVFSVALTVSAIQAAQRSTKILLTAGAILTGWAYIWLVDYAIGMEAFRFLCVLMLVRRSNPTFTIRAALARATRVGLVNLLIPFCFLLWRMFFFGNERKATDIGTQLGVLLANPVETSMRWLVQLLQSVLSVGFLAWVVPFSQSFFELRLRDILLALVLAAIVVSVLVMADRYLVWPANPSHGESWSVGAFPREALWLGLLGIAFGVLPVVLANRSVTFSLSHYALPASLAGAVLVAGLVSYVEAPAVQLALFGGLIAVAVLTHYAVQANALSEEKTIQEFWWQVSWRAPSIRAGTTMVINYPSAGVGDDGFGVMEAPNLIYYSDVSPVDSGLVHYSLSAISASDANAKEVLVGNLYRETGYRSHTVNFDYGNILVLSQPTSKSCVHVIDAARPVLSVFDPGNIVLLAPKSDIENVLADATPSLPEEFAFGPEPPHTWCYYYEKADLAVQREDWARAASLGEEAMRLRLTPEDQAEWLPFLAAYAILDDEKQVKNLSTRTNIDNFVRIQACLNLRNSETLQSSITPEMQLLVAETFCRNVGDQ